jgi:SSS family solute:Na+ symporter
MVWISLGWGSEFMGGPGVYAIIPGFIASWIAIMAVSSMTADAGEYQHIER